ncbi:polysaccharide deacetylase family protein [Roseimaritima ulvae]|uniref:Polysaccharide deacetylase n=1 Tax=Roseimaritima ulvae TaxID=980254 RepID=A0A5B9QMX2_9BACT|nr:hypothetical protein [Roseimaritima ulvae]QEG38970.1 hypothetical protein UC8_09310 [Roseimaritima ulvae]
MLIHDCQRSPARRAEQDAFYRFAFQGAAGDVLQQHFQRDVEQARLSLKFRLYYRFRHLLPIAMRQRLQRGRNQGLQVADDWYLSPEFVADLRAALALQPAAEVLHPWPDGHHMASVLTHDVETRSGVALVDRLAALEESRGLRSCWNFIPYKYALDEGLLADLKQRGHEVGVHGYNHDGRLFESRRVFDRRVPAINEALTKLDSVGFRAPMVHRNLQWLQALTIDYDASCFDVDPYQAMPGGIGSVWPFMAGKFVELPYTLPQDHTLFVTLKQESTKIWLRKLDLLQSLAGMALMLTHPDYTDSPLRRDTYAAYLDKIAEQPGCWHALPHQVARWWRQRDALQYSQDSDSLEAHETNSPQPRWVCLHELFQMAKDSSANKFLD